MHRRLLIALDGLAAAIAAVVFVVSAVAGQHGAAAWARGLLAAAAALPIAAVRLRPRLVFGVVLAASLGWSMLDGAQLPFVATAYAMFHCSSATSRPRRVRAVTAVLVSLGGVGLLTAVGSPRGVPGWWIGRPQVLALLAAVLACTWTAGQIVRDRRLFAQRAAEQAARSAVAEERLRIARELHDSVAHSMGVIAIKAAVAGHVADRRPDEVRDALRVIETTSKGALAEMRHLLGVLRSDDDPGEHEPPGMAALPALARRATAAGVTVDVTLRDTERLPATLELPVYRIVQEALTNVVKHAAPTRCRVGVTAAASEVSVEVCDEGRPDSGPPPGRDHGRSPRRRPGGHGLIGMRERIAAYGGTFSAGPRPEGGFRVLARIPYHEEPA
ncbi:sensor histidine kinase [Dactylosporangium sp. AC04546]|uniref:sensor histidine kinase n=1 Tax=Dactylosporangium sp. AC04546 TaxID=2862460 RepID=UPI001EDE2E9F|nr:sensor histidine kinase [Dactylosporangium sp. AC04546]WVK89685.1 sensor histidine kinase [Dactylosporangium sp. AC04546]